MFNVLKGGPPSGQWDPSSCLVCLCLRPGLAYTQVWSKMCVCHHLVLQQLHTHTNTHRFVCGLRPSPSTSALRTGQPHSHLLYLSLEILAGAALKDVLWRTPATSTSSTRCLLLLWYINLSLVSSLAPL